MTIKHRRRPSKFFITIATLVAGSVGLWASLFVLPQSFGSLDSKEPALAALPAPVTPPEPPPPPKHLSTPEPVRGVYMSSWVAGTPSIRDRLVKLIDDTELNAVVIDIKDYTGRISFATDNPLLQATGAPEKRIPDIEDFIGLLHRKEIYVIGRIATFQDPFLTLKRPDLAVKRASDGAVWGDYKKARWLDPASRETWDYIVTIAQESEKRGFDELNFDYIRFPSDGNMRDISYPFFDQTKLTKADSLKEFFAYLREKLGPLDVPLSADFFGMTATNNDDLNIGQLWENGLIYFDYVAPMVYPSHYPPGFMGYKNPALYPYEIVKHSLEEGLRRAKLVNQPASKIRPWLQDFDLGAPYTAEVIRKEKQAVADAGLTSWMMWNAGNQYTKEALDNQP